MGVRDETFYPHILFACWAEVGNGGCKTGRTSKMGKMAMMIKLSGSNTPPNKHWNLRILPDGLDGIHNITDWRREVFYFIKKWSIFTGGLSDRDRHTQRLHALQTGRG